VIILEKLFNGRDMRIVFNIYFLCVILQVLPNKNQETFNLANHSICDRFLRYETHIKFNYLFIIELNRFKISNHKSKTDSYLTEIFYFFC